MSKTKKILLSLSFIIALLCCHNASYAQRNVILVIADDLGSDYCGFNENHLDTIPMPNIRRLLSRGVRFRNAWTNPVCSPTRAGLLTGRYSFRTGVGSAIGGAGSAVLDTAEMTIPKLLNRFKPNGIAKGHIGKWHLQLPMPITNYQFPNKMGYDHFEGGFTGELTSFYNWTKVTNGVASNSTNYATTENVNNAWKWVKAQGNKQFFLWLAFNAPHIPHHLPPAGLHPYKTLSGTATDIAANPKSYFKASVATLDHELGRLFDSLQVYKQWENTDIIFIGDNGNEATTAQRTGGAKGSVYEQGLSVPFIISGPSVVNPGRSSEALVDTHDLFATILELFGYTNWQSQIAVNKPVDSKSIMPIIKNTSTTIRTYNFSEVFKGPNASADGKTMRNAQYKLIDFDNGTQRLYNLLTDPLESIDLLTKPMTAEATTNYNTLCTEIANLVGKSGCAKTVSIVLANEVEINNKEPSIYPNPFTDYINIDNVKGDEIFQLTNSLGISVYNGRGIKNQDFSNLPVGVYILEIKGKEITKYKLVKY